MKKTALLLLTVISVLLGGCAGLMPGDVTTESTADFNTTSIVIYTTAESQTDAVGTTAEEDEFVAETHTSEVAATEQQESSTHIEVGFEDSTVSEEKTGNEEKTTREERTTAYQGDSDVDLSISMPEKNGTMETDASPDNKYIKIVNKERKIAAALLLAVYSVPESGQNYVFEFYDADDFTADNIRRVYLIDSYGDIISVAATESSEKENISPVENWFCMNVLIKEIIYPAVSERD